MLTDQIAFSACAGSDIKLQHPDDPVNSLYQTVGKADRSLMVFILFIKFRAA